MSKKGFRLKATLLALVAGLVAVSPARGGSAIIGSVAGSTETTVDGVALHPNTLLFSGDSLQVKGGLAIVAVGNTSRMVFGRDTVASFLGETNEVTVLLRQGNVSLFNRDDRVALRVKAGDVSVTPAAGSKTLGEIAALSGCLVVTSKEGTLVVDNGEQRVRVVKGKTLTISFRPARTPQGGAATAGAAAKTGPRISGAVAARIAAVGLSGASVITSAIVMSRAGEAKADAITADINAASALSAAQAAASEANAAASLATSACNGLYDIYQAVISPSLPVQPAGDTVLGPIWPCGNILPHAPVPANLHSTNR